MEPEHGARVGHATGRFANSRAEQSPAANGVRERGVRTFNSVMQGAAPGDRPCRCQQSIQFWSLPGECI